MAELTKEELRQMLKGGKLRKVSAMTNDDLMDTYFFQCQKKTHELFRYLKVSHRVAEKMKKQK